MRFKNSPQLPGAGRTRAWHHHGSDTPTSPRAIYVLKSANGGLFYTPLYVASIFSHFSLLLAPSRHKMDLLDLKKNTLLLHQFQKSKIEEQKKHVRNISQISHFTLIINWLIFSVNNETFSRLITWCTFQ